jgi:Zn-dependent peptidase ImmA (M78 family)
VSGAGGEQPDAPNSAIERFCNAVAAAALIPRDWLLSETLVRQKGSAKTWDDEELEALALRFGVSREALLRRLLTLGRTTQAFYDSKRPEFLKEYAELEEQKNEGGPKHHIQVLSQLGRGYTRLVFQGYHERRLTLRDVANHFNMQVKLIPEMERAAFGIKDSV